MEQEYKSFREMNKTAFVLGYTGETGKALVEDLVNSNIFKKILLFGRREVPYPEEEKYKCLEQRTIDFDNLETHKSDFEGCEVGYCCLGTRSSHRTKEEFYKVDYEYIVNAAKMAKDTGCKQFHLTSGLGANPNSWIYKARVKGETERDVKAIDFDRCAIYQPIIIMSDRQDTTLMQKIIYPLLKPIMWLSPSLLTSPTKVLGKAMVNYTVLPSEEKLRILSNKDIFRVAGDIKKN